VQRRAKGCRAANAFFARPLADQAMGCVLDEGRVRATRIG